MATERIERLPAFQPAHPGEILREDVLPGLDLPRAKLAQHLGVSRQTLYITTRARGDGWRTRRGGRAFETARCSAQLRASTMPGSPSVR